MSLAHKPRGRLATSAYPTQHPVPWGGGQVTVSGHGKHLGISVKWKLRWQASGSFYEEIQGKELAFKWGYDGKPGSTCWEVGECTHAGKRGRGGGR